MSDLNKLLEIRKKIIAGDFSNLNDMQFNAVTTVKGPLLILAGAGSGKTTVIINRIINLIKYGNAYNSNKILTGFIDNPEELLQRYYDGDASVYEEIKPMLSVDAPKPWQILAITFTNKAADELKERLKNNLGDTGDDAWASTFHSACVRILRRCASVIGYTSHFTIYDTDDSKRVIKECQRQLGIDDKFLPAKAILSEISNAKDELVTPDEYCSRTTSDIRIIEIGKVYKLYQEILFKADAMDFDDIIVNTVNLFRKDKETLSYYQNKFKYIMVDEYQDTNHAQYVLVSLLAGAHNNICVVGDDDQSIYSFRGATIENILSFEENFKNAVVIRLEENYRSTQTILDAANAVIRNNTERKGKNLWTSNGKGEKISLKVCSDDMNEGDYVASVIMDESTGGNKSFSDFAVLYRMNSQSNVIERSLVKAGIPYKIIGGHRFYDRKEIKDALAYLAVVSNPNDNIRLRRIINEPKRGIGETTINNLFEISSRIGESVFDIMAHSGEYSALSRSSKKLKLFSEMIKTFSALSEKNTLAELFRIIMNESGYISSLENDEKKEERIDNLNELYSTIARYEEENGDNATLEGFLEEVALLSDIDNYESSLDTVTLMTLHSAKGLEFPEVFLVGLEQGIFPSSKSSEDPSQLEEERRLAYVGITRAKKKLHITRAVSRMQYGKTSYNPPSIFISEIPEELVENLTPPSSQYSADFFSKFLKPKNTAEAIRHTSNSGQSVKHVIPDSSLSVGEKKEAHAHGLKKGDTVLHKKFGKGLVLSTVPLGNDVLLEVAFDTIGTKKLMEGIANLQKLDN